MVQSRQQNDSQEIGTCFKFMDDDIRKFLPENMLKTDKKLTAVAQTQPKYHVFKKWLIDNGAIFDENIIYPAVFENGVVGVAAKRKIEPYTAYLFIPNSCIVSLDRAKSCDALRPVY